MGGSSGSGASYDALSLGPLDESAIEPMRLSIHCTTGRDVDVETLRSRVAASGRWGDHGAEYAVLLDGRSIGVVQAMYCERWGDPGSVEIGMLLFDPGDRGHGIGTRALQLWLDHLLDERGAFRVSFQTEPDNVAMIRVGERCGFRREGLVRGCALIDGELHDAVLYGLTRDDPRPQSLPG